MEAVLLEVEKVSPELSEDEKALPLESTDETKKKALGSCGQRR